MTTYFVNPLTGSDSNNGLSYATAVKNINAGPLASAVAGDQVRVLETPTVDTGLSTIFTRQTPPSTAYSISGATNTSPIVITFAGTANFQNGDVLFVAAVGGNTAAAGVWKINLLTPTTAELIGSVGNGAYTTGGTARLRTGSAFQLPTGSFCKNIFMCGNNLQTTYPYLCTNMTASSNVTCALNTTQFKYGNVSQNITIADSFTTGKAAYINLGATVDFSSYQAISCAILNQTALAIPDATYRICLCSDTTGDVIVDSIPINGMNVLVPSGSTTLWYKIYGERTGGGHLGSSIQSIAFYVNTDIGANLLTIDNIVAVKQKDSTTGINYQSIVGKNTSSGESLYTVGSMIDIVGTNSLIFIETMGITIASNNSPYYGGTSSTENLFKVNPFMVGPTATATYIGTIGGTGSAAPAAPVVYSGGWSAGSSMTTRSGLSAFANYNCTGLFIRAVNLTNFTFENLVAASFATPFTVSGGSDICLKNCYLINGVTNCFNCSTTPFLRIGVDRDDSTVYPCYANCSPTPVAISGCNNAHLNSFRITGSTANALSIGIVSSMIQNCYIGVTSLGIGATFTSSNYNTIKNCSFVNCLGTAINTTGSSNNIFKNCIAAPTNASPLVLGPNSCNNQLYNCTLVPSPTIFTCGLHAGNNYFYNTNSNGTFSFSNGANYFINCPNFSTTIPTAGTFGAGVTYIYNNNVATAPGYEIINCFADSNANISISQEQVKNNLSSYKVNLRTGVTVSGSKFDYNPYTPCLARVLVKSGVTTNISCYVFLSNSGATAKIAVLGGQVSGIPNDVVSAAVTPNSTWQKLTISVTPTADGVVEVCAYAYGYGSDILYYDKIEWEYI